MSVKYSPLPDSCTIKKSSIHGLGLFALEFIPNKTVLGISHIKDEEFEDGYIRTPLGGFFNHSESPNCEVYEYDRFLFLRAIKDIYAGEEITAFYTLYIPEKE